MSVSSMYGFPPSRKDWCRSLIAGPSDVGNPTFETEDSQAVVPGKPPVLGDRRGSFSALHAVLRPTIGGNRRSSRFSRAPPRYGALATRCEYPSMAAFDPERDQTGLSSPGVVDSRTSR